MYIEVSSDPYPDLASPRLKGIESLQVTLLHYVSMRMRLYIITSTQHLKNKQNFPGEGVFILTSLFMRHCDIHGNHMLRRKPGNDQSVNQQNCDYGCQL